jgi:hypothetical protein
MLLDIRDSKIREETIEWQNGEPVKVDVVPSIRERREACKLILAYTWGLPTQKVDFGDESGKGFAFPVVMLHPQGAEVLKNGQQATDGAQAGAERIGFDFGG